MAAVVTGAVASERRLSVWAAFDVADVVDGAESHRVAAFGEGQGRGVGREGAAVDGHLDALDARGRRRWT